MKPGHGAVGDDEERPRSAGREHEVPRAAENPRGDPDRIADGLARGHDTDHRGESVSAIAWSSRRYGSFGLPGAKTARST